MKSGILKKWNEDKGYGFIKPDGGSGDVFVHISAIRAGGLADPPDEGARVEFELDAQADRGPRASKVVLAQ